MCLEWMHVSPDGYLRSTREVECGAPTWSWASIGRKSEGGRGIVVESLLAGDPVPLVRKLDVTWNTPESNKFSDLSEAKITLWGRLLRGYAYLRKGGPNVSRDMVTMTEELEVLPREKITHHHDYGSEAWEMQAAAIEERWWLHICGERLGQRARIILAVMPDTCDCLVEGIVYLLPLADYPILGESTVLPGQLFALVLKEVTDGTFQRVGCARVSAKYLMTAKERSIVLV